MSILLDIIILVLTISALWLMGNRNRCCFIILAIVSILTGYIAIINELMGLLLSQLLFLCFDIRSYILWGKVDKSIDM